MSGASAEIGRLTRRAEFLAAAKGRRFHTERITVQAIRRDGTDHASSDRNARNSGEAGRGVGRIRVGFTVTKRVGHATERNRIKRRLRAAAQLAAQPHAAVPADIVIVGRRSAIESAFADLVGDLTRALPNVLRSRSSKERAGRSLSQAAGPVRRDTSSPREAGGAQPSGGLRRT